MLRPHPVPLCPWQVPPRPHDPAAAVWPDRGLPQSQRTHQPLCLDGSSGHVPGWVRTTETRHQVHLSLSSRGQLTPVSSCRLNTPRVLEPRGCHQAFRVPGRDHRRQVLLVLLLPAQHGGAVCGRRRQQPQKEPHVGHRQHASLWQCAGRHGVGTGRWRSQAPGPVLDEPAAELLRSLNIHGISVATELSEEALTENHKDFRICSV